MKPIPSYISELLYEHECVIIPGFGGFITSYAPAKIHPVQHTFTPPSKDILFNANLRRNDGLLANHMAEAEGITFTDASAHIQVFVNACLSKLNEMTEVEFGHIGIFSLNHEGAIQFKPDTTVNYLNDSYGLTRFVSPPIRRVVPHQPPVTRFVDKRLAQRTRQPAKALRQSVLILLPFVAIGLWSYFNSDAITDLHKNYSGVLSFTKSSLKELFHDQAMAVQKTDDIPEQYTTGSPAGNNTFILDSKSLTGQPATLDETSENTSGDVVVTSAPDPSLSSTSSVQTTYYTMAGAFREQNNASTLIRELKAKGFDAVLVDVTRSGLYRVAYQAFTTEEEAMRQLSAVRTTENPDAWILKK